MTRWINWSGGVCPVDGDAEVIVVLRCGMRPSPRPAKLYDWSWPDDQAPGNIVQYCLASEFSDADADATPTPLSAGGVAPAPVSARIDSGGPAFPVHPNSQPGTWFPRDGLTKREWYAGKAITALAPFASVSPAELASRAFEIADAMVAEGKKGGAA